MKNNKEKTERSFLMRLRLSLIIFIIFFTCIMVMGKSAREWNKEGLSLLEKGKYEEALNCFNKALGLDPGVAQLLNNKGYALYNIGKNGNNSYYIERSIEVYNQAISKKSDYDKAYYNKGLSLMYLNKYDEGKKCFKKVLEITPSDSDAEARIKECDSAMSSHLTKGKISELMKKADSCYDNKEYEKAITLYEAVLVIDPDNKDAIRKKTAAEVLAKHLSVTSTSVSVPGGKSYIEIVNGVSFEMVYIEGGTFQMGSDNGSDNEKPVHSVTVSGFYIGKYEVTKQGEYVMYNPGHKGNWSDGSYPVDTVSWDDAAGYCQWLSGRTGKNYRLPAEAQWEYACRAGTVTDYYWGNSINDGYCWYDKNSGNQTHPVGQKSPNAWGLFDMSGNVWEWCSDWYDEKYYSKNPSNNPVGPGTGSYHVNRGGSWSNTANFCRSSVRGRGGPSPRAGILGFRLSMTP